MDHAHETITGSKEVIQPENVDLFRTEDMFSKKNQSCNKTDAKCFHT